MCTFFVPTSNKIQIIRASSYLFQWYLELQIVNVIIAKGGEYKSELLL
jgi:hypothetical protein